MNKKNLDIKQNPGKGFLILAHCLALLFFAACNDDRFTDPIDNDGQKNGNEFELAKIDIATENGAAITSKEYWTACNISITAKNEEWNYSGTGKIKGRGNSSWLWYEKKPYRIELDEKTEIMGLAEEKDWNLLAEYRDPTQLMNTFVYTVGQGLGFPFCNHSRYAEVSLNDRYIGLYLLTEKVEQGKNRVAIDSAGGVLLSLDVDDGPELSPNAGDNFWSEVYHMPVCLKSPKNAAKSRLTTIRAEFAMLETAIKNYNYAAVEDLLDIPSFIDFLIIQELVYNVELAAPRSMYMHRDVAGRWTMGPLWDFDAAYDFDWSTMMTGHDYFGSYQELVLGTKPANHTGGYPVPGFFTDLFRNEAFVNEYRARWNEISARITGEFWPTTKKFGNSIYAAMGRDAERWPIGKNFETEIGRMEEWLNKRVDYLTTVISNY